MPGTTTSKSEKELTAENADLRERLARSETARAAELTDPAQAEALLRESEENFRSLVAALSEGIVMQNAAGEIVTCNPSAERILGLTRDQMAGRTSVDPRWRSVRADGSPFPGDEHPSMVTLRTGEPQRNVIMGVHLPDGGLHWISINSEPLFRAVESLPYAVVVTFADVTEQKQNEEELRKLVHAVEHGPVSVVITNLLGEIEYANPKFTETTGYSLAELIKQNPRILKSGDTNPSAYEKLWATITSGREWHGEFHNRKKNGDLYWEKASIAPVLTKTGEITHFIAIKEDITEQKRIADELATAAKRNQILLETANDGIHVLDMDGNVVEANAAFCSMLGYSREEALNLKLSDIDLQWSDDELIAKLRELFEHPSAFETRVKRKDGSALDVEINAAGVVLEGQSYLYSAARDITQRKRAEESLLTRELKHRSVIANISDVIGILGVDAYVQYMSPNIERWFGWQPQDLVGTDAWLTIHPDDLERIQNEFLALVAAEGSTKTVEYRLKCKDGTYRFIKLTAANLINDPIINGVLLNFRDITERIHAEAMQKEALGRLEKIASRVPGVVYQYRLRPDGSSCFPFASEAMKEIYRVSPDDVREDASRVFECIHPDDLDRVASTIQASARDLTPWLCEYRVKYDDGTSRSLFGNSMPQLEDDGSVLWHGYITDITHLKKVEDDLRASENRLDLATSAGNIGIWDWDIVNDTLVWDETMYSLYGIQPDDFGGAYEAWSHMLHPDDRDFVEGEIEAGLWGKREYAPEFRIVRPDGGIRTFQAVSQTTRDQDGNAIRMIGVNYDVTDRKLAEETLRETRDRLDFALEQADLACWELDAATNTFTFNDKFYELYATTAEDEGGYVMAADVYAREFIPEDEQSLLKIDIGELMTDEVDNWRREHVIRRRDGELRNIAVRANVVRDDQGRVTGSRGSNQDITERVRADEALRTSELKLRSILDSSRDAIGVHLNGIWEMANPAAVKLFGVSSVGDLLGTPIFNVIAPSEHKTVKEYVRTRSTGGDAPLAYVTRGLRPDGTEFDMDVTLSEFELEGQPHVLVVLRDITDQLRSREKIEALQQLLSNVINQTPYIVFANDLEHRPILGNGALFKFMGKPEAEVIGRPLNELFPPEMLDGFISANETVISSGETISFEEYVFGREYLTTKFPIFNKSHEIVGVGGIIVDMTERAKQEEELRREQTLAAVGTLASGIAHDFNNLMTVVTGFSELALQNAKVDGPLKPQIEQIMEAGNRAAELTHLLLAFGQKQFLRPQRLDMNRAVSDMDGLLRRTLPDNIVIATDLEPQLCPIKADPDRINEVILNLAVHARDQMPEGGVLTISTRNVDAESLSGFAQIAAAQKYVVLTIADTGREMKDVELQRLFDPYFSTKGIGHGAGITMAAVYGIVKQSGGDIKVQSVPGKGSTFEIVFPCLESGSAINK